MSFVAAKLQQNCTGNSKGTRQGIICGQLMLAFLSERLWSTLHENSLNNTKDCRIGYEILKFYVFRIVSRIINPHFMYGQ